MAPESATISGKSCWRPHFGQPERKFSARRERKLWASGVADMTCPTRLPGRGSIILRKEVIQPQVPLRLPCYDLVPIRKSIFGGFDTDFGCPSLSWLDGRCVQGSGTHSPRCC